MNYSEIIKNRYQIMDDFKKLKDRFNRVENKVGQNRQSFFRAFKQNKIELDAKRYTFDIQEEFLVKKGISMTQDVEEKANSPVKKSKSQDGISRLNL